ncbi:aldehyde dehydrogenase family protein [Nakamurella sp. YIM 132087]|uniref:Aldehyde dehydrogenase family protein n=1 Tax=Nakamurella alba TaxID=2665158 RepID=A0A7K1FQA8_9ACTN|nr:NAD-dependent succinate-semialdehyde dehydrogenase [Nakamurella alba]MTD16326.1 aldehyde dehydrogenase family protein [Nakamurella alba]
MTQPIDAAAALDGIRTDLYIDGHWRSTARTFPVEDPASGETIAEMADAGPADAVAALAAATGAGPGWAATEPRVRAEILRRAFDLLMSGADRLATVISLEMGKPLAESRAEIAYGAEFLRWFSEESVRISGRYSVAPTGGTRLLTMRRPVGPVLAITPWNFPLAMATRKVGPALAAGCTVVLKPAAQTPLTAAYLVAVLEEAGVPPGVVNLIPTSGSAAATAPVLDDPRLRKLTFTGSTEVGRALLGQAATRVLRTSMELGGNAPFLVFPDADLEKTLDGAVLAKMRNTGQACTAANRFLVHESVAPAFADGLARQLGALRIGPGTEPATQVGPLIDGKAVAAMERLVAQAIDDGARPLTGGERWGRQGHFYAPTVLVDVPPGSALLREEIFGPIAPVTTFASDEEAVRLANDTSYGLVGYVFTRDLSRAINVSEQLETGMIGLNQGIVSNPAAPFGGVKESGLGREGGPEGIDEYLETTYLGIAL